MHHFSSSWWSSEDKLKLKIEKKITPVFGRRLSQIVGRMIAEVKVFGLRKGFNHITNYMRRN